MISMRTLQYLAFSSLPEFANLFDLDLKITIGDAAHTIFSREAILDEIGRHDNQDDVLKLREAVFNLPENTLIDIGS